MKPELSSEEIGLYLQYVVTSVETPRAGRNGQLLFRCPIRSEPPHDISMDPGTGKWLCLGGTCGSGDIFDYHAGKFKIFDYRQPEIAVLKITRDAQKKAQRAEEAARAARDKTVEDSPAFVSRRFSFSRFRHPDSIQNQGGTAASTFNYRRDTVLDHTAPHNLQGLF